MTKHLLSRISMALLTLSLLGGCGIVRLMESKRSRLAPVGPLRTYTKVQLVGLPSINLSPESRQAYWLAQYRRSTLPKD